MVAGVLRLITNGGEGPAHVPDRIIDELRAREGRDGLITLPRQPRPGDRFQPGDRVRITGGPLTGLVGRRRFPCPRPYPLRAAAGLPLPKLIKPLLHQSVAS